MRRWLAGVAKLYPREWRARYGEEFDALMEDVTPDWREFADVLGGAVRLQVQSERGVVGLIGAMGIAGVVVAACLSFVLPGRYVSTAVLAVSGPAGKEVDANDFYLLKEELLSRAHLASVILTPSLDLYRNERARVPMEDIIERMRKDLRIEAVAGGEPGKVGYRISFAYPDGEKAKRVAEGLTSAFVQGSMARNREREHLWRQAWNESAPAGTAVEVVQEASEPERGGPDRAGLMGWGLGGGVLLGIVVALLTRQPRLTLRVAGFGLAGFAAAAAASYLIPDRYTSSAVIRFSPPLDPARWYGGKVPPSPAERLRALEQQVLSDQRLERLIHRPSLNLYEREQASESAAQLIARLRERDLRIRALGPGGGASQFEIAFTYRDPKKAQAVVREVISGLFEQNVVEERERFRTASEERRLMAERRLGDNLEVLDAASYPETPVSPNRLILAAMGMGAGVMLGGFAARRQVGRRPEAGTV